MLYICQQEQLLIFLSDCVAVKWNWITQLKSLCFKFNNMETHINNTWFTCPFYHDVCTFSHHNCLVGSCVLCCGGCADATRPVDTVSGALICPCRLVRLSCIDQCVFTVLIILWPFGASYGSKIYRLVSWFCDWFIATARWDLVVCKFLDLNTLFWHLNSLICCAKKPHICCRSCRWIRSPRRRMQQSLPVPRR